MSHADRDWWRDERASRRAFAWSGTVVVWTLMGVLLAAWLIVSGSSEHAGPGGVAERVRGWASLSAEGVLSEGRAWQPLTWCWLHEAHGARPVLWSLLLLFFFGREAERDLGGRAALATFVAGGVASGLLAIPWLALVVGDASLADASGGTFALAAAVARRRKGERWDPGVPVRGWVAFAIAVRTADLLLVGGGPAYAPVLAGAAVGWLAGGVGFATRSASGAEARGAPATTSAAASAPANGAERARLDGLLAKIHDSGIDALTAEEREFLERASERYRDRSSGSR